MTYHHAVHLAGLSSFALSSKKRSDLVLFPAISQPIGFVVFLIYEADSPDND